MEQHVFSRLLYAKEFVYTLSGGGLFISWESASSIIVVFLSFQTNNVFYFVS